MLASGILLSGCDLWSGSEEEPANNARVASAEEPVVIAQMEEASSANGSYLFGVTNVTGTVRDMDADGKPYDRITLIGKKLHVVDPATGLELDGGPIDVDAESTQLVTQAFTMSADGLSQRAGQNVELLFTNAHKLYKVSLLANMLLFKQQVSSETHVCQLIKAIQKDANAAASWILMTTTTNADGDCSVQEELVTKLVASDAASDVPAVNSNQIGQVLAVQRDTQGRLIGVLGLAPWQPGQASRQMVLMRADTGAVSNVSLGLDAGLTVSYFDRVAGSQTKAYVRGTNGTDTNKLYVVDWATGTASVSRTPAADLDAFDSVFVHADASANYFVDGLTLKSLKPGGTTIALGSLSLGEPQSGGVMTSSYLVVPQQAEDGTMRLQAFSKTTPNSVRNIAPPQAGGSLSISAHNGNVLVVSQSMDPNSAQVTLWRVDLNPQGITYTLLSEQATGISATQAALETLTGEQQQANVLWSQAVGGGALSVSSYQLSMTQPYLLAGSVSAWDLAQTAPLSLTQGLLTSTTGASDTLWLFDTSKAASLTPVKPAAAMPR